MSERQNRGGRRQAADQPTALARYWGQYRDWLAGLTRGQRIRYRILQVATVISIIIIVAFFALKAWIQVPDIPVIEPSAPTVEGTGAQTGTEITFEGAQLPEVAKSGRKPGYYTFLVAGRDVISGATDTMLLFTFDSEGKNLNALSLPRDTMINTKSSSKRLNTVYARNRGSSSLDEKVRVANGMTALKQEVSKLTGIYPDFYVLVEWDAIGELVDALGGVEFDVPYLMDYKDPEQDLYIYQEPGLRVLNGEDAMQVIRWRKNNGSGSDLQVGDTGRMEIQQSFLKAVMKKCMEPATLLKVSSLSQVFLDNVSTDLTVGNILAFAQLAIGMDLQEGIRFSTVPYSAVFYHGASMVLPQQKQLLELLNGGMNPYLDEIRSSDLQMLYKKSDGSFGVTKGELADPAMGEPPVKEPEQPEVPAEPVPLPGQPGTELPPEAGDVPPQEGEVPSGTDTPSEMPSNPEEGQNGEESAPSEEPPLGTIDPADVLPDPNDVPSQDVRGASEEKSPIMILPTRPQAVA